MAVKRWPHAKSPEHAALCDSLDGVLDKVRGLGSVAEPFLMRVTRADAPNYADVVACPMDLGTMSKKLRAGNYLTVAEFEADMQLIAANAACFNGPGAPYTLMAAQVRDAALAFIAALPAQQQSAVLVPAAARETKAVIAEPARSGSLEVEPPCSAPPAAGSPPSADMKTPEQEAELPEPAAADNSDADAAALSEPDELLADLCSDAWKDCTQPGPALPGAELPPLPIGTGRRRVSTAPNVASAYTEPDARAALQSALMQMLRGTGFSAADESAVDLLAGVTADRLILLGTTLGQHADARARADLGSTPGMLRASDGDVPPELAMACVGRLGYSWKRLAATAAATGGDAEQAKARKKHCSMEL